MKIPITQSQEWHKLQEDLGETSFFVEKDDYTYLAILKSTPVGKYLYLPYGPCFTDQASFTKAIDDVTKLASEHEAVFIRIEPFFAGAVDYLPKTAVKSKDLNPKETWILDLDCTDDELKAKLPSRLLRYHKSADKKGITIKISQNPDDIKHLVKLQKALADSKNISVYSENYLKTELSQPFASLYLVEYQAENYKEIVAAGLVFDDEDTRYNLQGAQSDLGRTLHATGILTIQLILDAKAKNLKTFDFWGIAPEGAPRSHPWAGFTNFKKTFAGEEQDHAGTYDIVLKPVKYQSYKLLRKIRRLAK